MGRTRSYSDAELAAAVASSSSWRQTMMTLGLNGYGGGTHAHMQKLAESLGISSEHFTGPGWNRGMKMDPSRIKRRNIEEILVQGSSYDSNSVRKRLLGEGLKEPRCESCGISEWMGMPAPLQLDHINGVKNDHRIENLRILCPNCHAQTPTWCGKNKKPKTSS